jgi:hypothetical protein
MIWAVLIAADLSMYRPDRHEQRGHLALSFRESQVS